MTNRMSPEYQRNVSDFVQREVICCLSTMISEMYPLWEHVSSVYQDDLMGAYETEPDYEDAARDHNWDEENGEIFSLDNKDEFANSWEEACDISGIDVDDYRREVFEHWAVTSMLANELEEHGEKVIRDFMGFDIWCRTTTGQAISIDEVICDIWDDLQKRTSSI
jgi:hypothetical protein